MKVRHQTYCTENIIVNYKKILPGSTDGRRSYPDPSFFKGQLCPQLQIRIICSWGQSRPLSGSRDASTMRSASVAQSDCLTL